MTGYFYLARGLFEHPLFKTDSPLSEREAWVWLIEQANYDDGLFRHGNQVFFIPRGSLGTRYRSLAEKWRWSPNRVIRVLNLWQTQGMIGVGTEHGFVHLTLCNYDEYQRPWNTDGTATEQQRDAGGTATDTKQIKEIKVKKETKNKPPTPILPAWVPVDAWGAFVEMRKSIGKRMTPKAELMLLDRLDKLRHQGHDPTGLLNRSTLHNWLNVFPEKDQDHATTRKHPGRHPEKPTWTSSGDQLAAEYARQAELEEQAAYGPTPEPDMRLAEIVWEDPGRA